MITKTESLEAFHAFRNKGHYSRTEEEFQRLPPEVRDLIRTDEIHSEEQLIHPNQITHELMTGVLRGKIKELQPRFTGDKDDLSVPIIEALSQYLRRDEAFLKLNDLYSFEKGIMLHGFVGCGKTLIMQALCNLSTKLYKICEGIPGFTMVPSYEVTQCFGRKGYEVFSLGLPRPDASYPIDIISRSICIDDIGSEPKVTHYGNSADVIGELITMRYDKKIITCGTTNLDVKSLKDKYGDRVYSRMKEMFNFIYYKGNDRRK